ncbi:MAG: hypothetical protein L3K03_09570 [Thermoplasmata archaeon]|nr:hypothetical protein [Thermoplasmata archaeon]
MPRAPAPKPTEIRPEGFQIWRDAPAGRHPLMKVFPGIDKLPIAKRQEPTAKGRAELYGNTCVEIVEDDMWMYIAPWKIPALARARGWNPVVTPDVDCIVIGQGHLKESPELTVFMDIYHEICHLQQRHRGMELFASGESYVKRITELEAYRFVVDEARSLGVDDDFLRDYLHVEWITEKEFRELLASMDVPPAPRTPRVAAGVSSPR